MLIRGLEPHLRDGFYLLLETRLLPKWNGMLMGRYGLYFCLFFPSILLGYLCKKYITGYNKFTVFCHWSRWSWDGPECKLSSYYFSKYYHFKTLVWNSAFPIRSHLSSHPSLSSISATFKKKKRLLACNTIKIYYCILFSPLPSLL